jgi:hypothetical protein
MARKKKGVSIVSAEVAQFPVQQETVPTTAEDMLYYSPHSAESGFQRHVETILLVPDNLDFEEIGNRRFFHGNVGTLKHEAMYNPVWVSIVYNPATMGEQLVAMPFVDKVDYRHYMQYICALGQTLHHEGRSMQHQEVQSLMLNKAFTMHSSDLGETVESRRLFGNPINFRYSFYRGLITQVTHFSPSAISTILNFTIDLDSGIIHGKYESKDVNDEVYKQTSKNCDALLAAAGYENVSPKRYIQFSANIYNYNSIFGDEIEAAIPPAVFLPFLIKRYLQQAASSVNNNNSENCKIKRTTNPESQPDYLTYRYVLNIIMNVTAITRPHVRDYSAILDAWQCTT